MRWHWLLLTIFDKRNMGLLRSLVVVECAFRVFPVPLGISGIPLWLTCWIRHLSLCPFGRSVTSSFATFVWRGFKPGIRSRCPWALDLLIFFPICLGMIGFPTRFMSKDSESLPWGKVSMTSEEKPSGNPGLQDYPVHHQSYVGRNPHQAHVFGFYP